MKYQSNLLRRAFSTTQSLLAAMLVATVASAGLAADPDYFSKYESMRMTRDANGVLLLEMNTKGGPLKFSARDHEQFVDAFYDVGRDRDNKVVILTGKGGDWIGDIDFGSFGDVWIYPESTDG